MREQKFRQPSPGKPKPALTRLKELPAEQRARVMEILRANTYKQARPIVEAFAGFACATNPLCQFFSWQAKQDELRASEDMAAQVGRFIREHRTDWSEEKVPEVAGTFFIMQAINNKDVGEFVRVARVGLQDGQKQLNERRLNFRLGKLKAAGGGGLDAMLEAVGGAFGKGGNIR